MSDRISSSRRRRPQWQELDDEALDQLEEQQAETRRAAGQVYDSEDELDQRLADAGDDEPDSGGESDQEGGRRVRKRQSTRDGEMIASARLRQQGIQAEGDRPGEDEDEDASEDGEAASSSSGSAAGKPGRPQHALEHVFGRAADTAPMERFSARVDPEEAATVSDAWLESVQPGGKQVSASLSSSSSSGDSPDTDGQGPAEEEEDEFDRRQRLQKEERRRRREQAEAEAAAAQKQGGDAPPSQLSLLGRLIGLLEAGETIPKALRRLGTDGSASGAAVPKKPQGFKKNVRKNAAAAAAAAPAAAGSSSGPQETPEQQEQRRQRLSTLTDLSADLVKLGMMNVYAMEREALVRTFQAMQESQRRQAEAERRAAMAKRMPSWEYRWAADDPEVHGPFSGDKMNEWREHFDSAVVRVVKPGCPPGPWRPAREFPDFRVEPASSSSEAAKMQDDGDDKAEVKDGVVSSTGSSAAASASNMASPGGRKRSAAAVTAPPEESDEDDIFAVDGEQDSKRLRR